MSTKKPQPVALSPRQVTMVFEEIALAANALDGLLGILETEALEDASERAAVTAAAVLLTEDVAKVLNAGDPDGLIEGFMAQGKGRGVAVDMGAFWYGVSAGEIKLRRSGG